MFLLEAPLPGTGRDSVSWSPRRVHNSEEQHLRLQPAQIQLNWRKYEHFVILENQGSQSRGSDGQ